MRRRSTSPARHSLVGEQRTHNLAQILELEKEQLRGVPIPTLLSRAARLFSRSGAAAREAPKETYALSRTVGRLDYFISHAWVSPRLGKYCALCRYFNGSLALHAALLSCYIFFFWALHRTPVPGEPMTTMANQIDQGMHTVPRFHIYLFHAPFIAYFLTAAMAHTVLSRRHTAFLDIACVNQLDAAAKAAGIERLGAVLARTERMLVLADEHYWRRLWCVFEVAAFCRHADASRLVILPLHSALTELGMVFFWYVLALMVLWSRMQTGTDHAAGADVKASHKFLAGIIGIIQPCLILPMMMGHRSRSALRALREFSIADSQCYSPDDRQALIEVICSWYTDHHAGEDHPERLRALGQYKFETFVRHHLAPAIERQEAGEALRVGFLGCVVSLMPWCFLMLSARDSSVGHVGVTLLYLAALATCICPLSMLIYRFGTSATFRVIREVLPRLAGPRTALRRLLTAGVHVLGFLLTAACFPFLSLILAPTRPTKFLAPDWRIPTDDGLDEETRRFTKHWIVLGTYMLGMIGHFIWRGHS